jgi:WD40 repeat protein
MTSYQTKQIATDHNDLIQDIAFDFYGKRAATASLDQSVKIWNINENNEWVLKGELKVNRTAQINIQRTLAHKHANLDPRKFSNNIL